MTYKNAGIILLLLFFVTAAIGAHDTVITSSPPAVSNSSSATFTFTSTESGKFECRLDTNKYSECDTPKEYPVLTDGSHTFNVRTEEGEGKNNPGTASYTWIIDTTAPDTNIIGHPPAASNSSSATFTFTSESGKFECRLDDTPEYLECDTPKEYPVLADGSHIFYVRAIDDANNTDPTPATYSWTIDTTAPDQVTGLVNDTPTRTTVNLSWHPTTNASHYRIYRNSILNGTTQNIYWNETGLKPGTMYQYQVRANDSYNNWGEYSSILPVNTAPDLDIKIEINKNALPYTNSTSVILDLTSSMTWMSFSNGNTNWTDWEKFYTTKSWILAPGDGTKNVYFSVSNDNSDEKYTNEIASIILDTTKPVVTDISLPSITVMTKDLDITASISDINPLDKSSIFVIVRSPDGNTSKCNMTLLVKYNCNFKNTSGYGRYDVTYSASDLAGNINNTEKTWFITTMKPFDKSVSTVQKIVEEINALKEANTTLEFVTSGNIFGAIKITMSNEIPPGISQSIGSIPFRKFISIITSSEISDSLNWMNVRVYYTEDELKASGLDENSLRISHYNESSSKWETPAKNGVDTTNKDNFSGFVWANVSHLSTFGVVGSYPAPATNNPSGGGSSGGGGGGGGGSSGENYANIELIEKYDLQISKDVLTSYRFTHEKNPIMFVDITGNTSIGIITTSAEVLRNTSTLAKMEPEWTVYKNVNIWVGTSGFANPRNIKQAVIKFRVEKSWISSNNIKSSDVKLARWDGSKWELLETLEIKEEGKFTYYDAMTKAFSPFAIIAIEMKESIPENAGLPGNSVIIDSNKPAAQKTEENTSSYLGTKWFILLGVFFVIGLIIEMYLWIKKK